MPRLGITRFVLVTLAIGAAGMFLGRWLQIPGGAFTGALLVTAVGRLLGGPMAEPPKWLRSLARIILGLSIGATVTPQTVATVGRALLPIAAMVFIVIALSLLAAWAIHRWAHMDLPTALCSTAPGALAAMVALADDLLGDARVVASMHLVRLLSVLAVIPTLVHLWFPRSLESIARHTVSVATVPLWQWAALLALGLAVGAVALRLQVPAAEILAGLGVATLLGPLWLRGAPFPGDGKLFAQWIVGASVGVTVTRQALRDFRPFALAGVLMTLYLLLTGLAQGWLLAQWSGIDLVTCLVGCAPGGADNLILLSDELGADTQLVTAMHISRMIIVVLLVPVLTRYAARPRAIVLAKIP